MSRITTGTPKPPLEKHLQKAGDDFLMLDGWRVVITDPPHMRGLGVAEPGIADRLYLRYEKSAPEIKQCFEMGGCGCAEVLWIEYKRKPGGNGKRALLTKAEKARIRQRAWIELERSRGALVWLAGEDFPATIEGLMEHYRASGLMRRNL